MTSDYEAIRRDNIREYGEGTRHLEFLGQLYSDRTHFIYELLQNAEDKGAKQVKFDLFRDRLEFLHDGAPFNEADIRGICGVGQGTKSEDLTKIGKFGVGFKSVYAYTSSPRIHCGDEHFLIEHYVRPYPTSGVAIPEGWTTRFVFPFDDTQADEAYREIAVRLRHLNVRTLLFLSTIQEIVWQTDGDESGCYLREAESTHEARRVTVIGTKPGGAQEDEEEIWLVFTRAVVTPDGNGTRPVEIAYLLEQSKSKQQKREAVIPLNVSPLFVFFATEKETRLGFLVQGPYKTTPARDNIPKDDRWNSYLIEETGQLVAESLVLLREMRLLSVQALEAMPISKAHFSPDSMFRPIYDAVAKALTEQRLLPAEDGDYVAASSGVIGRGSEIRRLLSSDQLTYLLRDEDDAHGLNEDDAVLPGGNSECCGGWRWLSGDISHDRTPGLRSYLTDELGIEEITPEWFARRVDKAFFEAQEDDWLVVLYRFLLKQEALWRSSKGRSWGVDGPLRCAEIIRLEDGRHVSAFDSDGIEAVYLPGSTGVELPYVKSTLVRDEEAAEFLDRLGLHQPDVVSQVIEHVLPQYDGEEINVSEEDHLRHMGLISEALSVGSADRVKKLKSRLDDACRILARNAASGNRTWCRPGAAYFRNPEMEVFLGGNPDAWFVDEIYDDDLKRVLLGLGVADSPKISLRPEGRGGFVMLRNMHGWHSRGLDGFDPECTVEHLEFALENPTVERSEFIWNHLARPNKRQIRGRVEKSSRQTYQGSTVSEVESEFGEKLLARAWIPNCSGDFFEPANIAPSDVPEGFEVDEILSSQLRMRGSDLSELAKKSGLELDDLSLIRELKAIMPNGIQQIRDLVQREKAKPEFPHRDSVNPERRERKATELANDAPEKQYEKRVRSVRVTSPPVGKSEYLRQSYTNDDGQLVCQLCHEEMPFRGRDGEYYFEAVQLIDDMAGEHAANHAALCPLCAAKFRELIKKDQEKSAQLRDHLGSSDSLEVEVVLGAERGSLRFVEKHYLDVNGMLNSDAD